MAGAWLPMLTSLCPCYLQSLAIPVGYGNRPKGSDLAVEMKTSYTGRLFVPQNQRDIFGKIGKNQIGTCSFDTQQCFHHDFFLIDPAELGSSFDH